MGHINECSAGAEFGHARGSSAWSSRLAMRHRQLTVWTGLALLACAIWRFTYSSWPLADKLTVSSCSQDQFAWNSVIPSETLEWVSCYERPFECARLEVPLDYARPHGQKAAIALIRLPSKYSIGHALWRGPILYNPGGPGGSGVADVLRDGHAYSRMIGDDFDHVAFDPRGVGFTTPSLQLFRTTAEAKIFALARPTTLNDSADSLARTWAWSKMMGKLVEERKEVNWVAQHMSTAIVARDMLAITRAFGREKLQYWGFSYGSVLGATYATMFPDKVERIIIDGVVDGENYYAGAWSNNLRDADAGLELAIASCSRSSRCPLFAPTSAFNKTSSPSVVRARIESILAALTREPLVARDNATGNYGVVDGATARLRIFRALYNPMQRGMEHIFAALAAAENGDGAPLLRVSGVTNALWRCESGSGSECGPTAGLPIMEVMAAIACGDGDVVEHNNLEDLEAFYDMWAVHTFCAGWKVRPVERFHGPLIANTSFPILLISNTADPVTPLWAAKKMSKGFQGSVVLTQNSPGHCSVAATSLCTTKAIRGYFRDGHLPSPNTICEVEDQIFEPDEQPKLIHDVLRMSEDDRVLLAAARDASARFKAPRLGLAVESF
ncbi:alpha/beta-hydrolase [Auriculariales sp. MPI-PUGE-AT-0066]|nr:alpha/beta-hydrolase [Auriculariales sp. MPI-PUGE-AT-0066]